MQNLKQKQVMIQRCAAEMTIYTDNTSLYCKVFHKPMLNKN